MKKYMVICLIIIFTLINNVTFAEDDELIVIEGFIKHMDWVWVVDDFERIQTPMPLEELFIRFYDEEGNFIRFATALSAMDGHFILREINVPQEILDATSRLTIQHKQRIRTIYPYTGGHQVFFIYD